MLESERLIEYHQFMSAEFIVDKRDLKDDDTAEIQFRVTSALRYLEGHFPHEPIVPGVAQLALIEEECRAFWPEVFPLQGLKRLKFMHAIRLGALHSISLRRTDKTLSFSVFHEEEECAKGTFLIRRP